MVKPSESSYTLERLAEDRFHPVGQFRGDAGVKAMTSCHLLVRVLEEQCLRAAAGTGRLRVTIRKHKEIASASLKNRSDPEPDVLTAVAEVTAFPGAKGRAIAAKIDIPSGQFHLSPRLPGLICYEVIKYFLDTHNML